MNDSRHEKAWNDPPLFSLDQMSRAGHLNRRNRYPQQTATNPTPNPMSNPMINPMTNPMTNQMSNQSNTQQMMATNPMMTQMSSPHLMSQNVPMMASNAVQNEPQYGYQSQQTNPVMNANYEPAFDSNALLYSVQMTIRSVTHLPPELVQQWNNIQNSIYTIPMDSLTKAYFQSLLQSIQSKDFNNCRLYSSYFSNHKNETIRAIGLTLNQIFNYFQ